MNSVQAAYQANLSQEDRDRLLMEQLPQVKFIARRIHDRLPHHVEIDDLIHAGVLGLMDALTKYDPAKNVQFKSYAQFRIRGAILDSLRELDWSPRDLRRKARALEEATHRLATTLNRQPTENELAHELGMGLEDFQRLLGDLRGLDIGSLQTENSEDGTEDDLLNYIPANPDESPFTQYQRSETRRLLASAIDDLPEKERQVLALYYYEELTMKEIGELLGVVESRVSQIHSAAMVRLRARLRFLQPEARKSMKLGA